MAKKVNKIQPVNQPLTEERFVELTKNFLIKDDVKNFTTKDDLKDFLTKDDAKNFLTKDDFYNGLGHFTEEVILPAVEDIFDRKFDEKIGEFRITERDYYDRKRQDDKADIISTIKGEKKRDLKFKEKVIEIFKRNKLVKPEELKLLSALAS